MPGKEVMGIVQWSSNQHTPYMQMYSVNTMQINQPHWLHELWKAVVALSACTAVECKKGWCLLCEVVCDDDVGPCNKIKKTAWSTKTPAKTERSNKSLCTSPPSLEAIGCWWTLFRLAALCTFLLVLLFGTQQCMVNQNSKWQLTALVSSTTWSN